MDTLYFKPKTLKEALELLNQYKTDILVVNGGTDAVLRIVEKKVSPRAILQVSELPGFHEITIVGGKVRIGGGATYNEMLASPLLGNYRGLREAILHLASPAIRMLGTPAGNICTAAPAADAAAMLYALEAEVLLESLSGSRKVPLKDFYVTTSSYSTLKKPEELVTAIEIPVLKAGDGTGYCRLSRRKAQDIGKVLVGAYLTVVDCRITHASISLGALNATLVHAAEIEKALIGKTIEDAVAYVRTTYPVEAKLHKSYFTAYKQDVVCSAVSRAAEMAIASAEGEI